MSSPYGIYGNDVSIEDVLLLLKELTAKSDDAINHFGKLVNRMDKKRAVSSPSFMTTSDSSPLPVWLQYPISLHDRLSRWLARHEKRREISVSTSAVLNESLIGVGNQLSDLSARYLTYKEQNTKQKEKCIDSIVGDKAFMALGLRQRRNEDMDRPSSYNVNYIRTYNNWNNEDFQQEYRRSLTQGLIDLKDELENLRNISSKVEEEINTQQDPLDETESAMTKVQMITMKVNEVMRSTRRSRLRWLPIGATLGGMSIGMIAGSPGGIVGLAIGGALGGATAGGAATLVIEE